jgi:hypothetical protein
VTNILGTSKDTLKLHTADENRDVALDLAQQARRELVIFSQQLDAPLYDNAEFERAVLDLARLHPSTKIRILVQDATRALHDGHSLLRLAQMLTSSVFIRKPSHDFREEYGAFIVADTTGYSQRVIGDHYNYDALASFMAPSQARQLVHHFNKMWEHAEEDPQLRRLNV